MAIPATYFTFRDLFFDPREGDPVLEGMRDIELLCCEYMVEVKTPKVSFATVNTWVLVEVVR